jgi:NADPH:quinone reductase-like Zn-dependent oxidoreductase
MKAVRIHAYGDSSVLRYEDAPLPQFGADEVLIRVIGSSVNPLDWKIREGHLKTMLPFNMPFIPGWDVSGIVHAVGASTVRFKIGDAVYSRPEVFRNGTYAEFVAVKEAEVAAKPRTISHIQAGVLPLAGIAAWEAIATVGNVQPGQRVLVHAAAGGVGSLAVQIAKAKGAHVIGTASRANRVLVESLGVDQFIDYKAEVLRDAVHNVDLVFDTVGGETQNASWHVMAPDGMLVSIISDPAAGLVLWPRLRASFLFIKPNAPVLNQLAHLVEQGQLRPIIGAEFALQDIRQAHALSESGHAVGKIALYVGMP